MSRPLEITDPDRARLVAYADGELGFEEAVEFEQRLSAEPELASALAALLEVDALGTRLASRLQPRRARRTAWGLLAAAVLIAGAWLATRVGGDPSISTLEVAALPVGYDLREYNEWLGLDPDVVPAGNRDERAPAGRTISADAYLELVRRAESARVATAFHATGPVRIGAFFIPVRVDQACSAVVVRLDAAGAAGVRFPESVSGGMHTERRLEPGSVHFLPEPRVVSSDRADRVRVIEGFSATTAREAWVVAVRVAPIPPGLWATLADELAALSHPALEPRDATAFTARAALVEAALRARGFRTQRLLIEAP